MSIMTRRFASRPWRWTLPLTLAVLTGAAACSVDPGPAPPPADGTSGTPTSSSPVASSPAVPSAARTGSTASSTGSSFSGVTPIRVIVNGRTLTAELYDNPTAHDLADQLPLTVTLHDLHGLEKTGPLRHALTTDGAPRGSDPEVNEIGYYAPGRDLVFYYGDVGYFNGIIRIGRFTSDVGGLPDQPDGFSVTIERA